MTPEQLEIAITEYLDGTLPPERVTALEERLASDPLAQAMLQEHEKLTALLRANPLPEMNWEELSSDFSAVVTGTVAEASREADQKLNGLLKAVTPLPAIEWDALGARISASIDEELAARDASDEKLDALLHATPLPNLNWDRLASHLSDRVAEAAGVSDDQRDEAPATVYRMPWVRTATRVAIAACLTVAAVFGVRSMFKGNVRPGDSSPVVVVNVKPAAVVEVQGPAIELAEGKAAVAEVEIGPSNTFAANSDEELYRRGVANRPQVVIALPVTSEETDNALGFE